MRLHDMHPISLVVYFVSVMCFTMMTMNPIILVEAILGAVGAVVVISHKSDLKLYVPMFLLIAITNPLFSHNGETILFFFRNQRITLEALLYGVGAAALITATIYWFKLFSLVFGTDKLTWAVGALSPKLSVVLTMAMRFIPLFKENAKNIYNAQLSLGIYDEKTIKGKTKLSIDVFSALISMSMENAVETADAMRARGFGRGKRTSYTLFKFRRADLIFIAVVIISDIAAALLLCSGAGDFSYYPHISFTNDIGSALLYIAYAILAFMPLINEVKEEIRWKYLISKI
jgi:energy-coupling factor transport system permease protein